MKCLATLSLLTALGKAVAVPSIPAPDSYNLTLVLGGEGDAQYWELTEENMPPGISSTEFMFTALSNSRRGLDKRGSIECSDSHQSGTADCVSLINALFRDLSGIPTSPRNIRYNNCYAQFSGWQGRGFMTGIVLDRHVSDLRDYYDHKRGPPVDTTTFMRMLVSAVHHLHSHGYAHNDINYRNVLVSAEGLPVLADFDSCKPIGEELTFSRGTDGWNDVPLEEYRTSQIANDLYGVKKIEEWLEGQIREPCRTPISGTI
ncbi:hypothetical protein VTK73DRAFT_10176 [Phialemonium thermophilum]|uniref:Protein kinase domain-containing protein n=1 Tax=Phialemonium thermophilum TaxID=223376 RepID=A0ABR3VY35_9PEZI